MDPNAPPFVPTGIDHSLLVQAQSQAVLPASLAKDSPRNNSFTPRNKRTSNGPEPSPADKYPEDSPVRVRPPRRLPTEGINIDDTEAFPTLKDAAKQPTRATRATIGLAAPAFESSRASAFPKPSAYLAHQQPGSISQDQRELERVRKVPSQPQLPQQGSIVSGVEMNSTYDFEKLEASQQAQRLSTLAQLQTAFSEPQHRSQGHGAPGETATVPHGLPSSSQPFAAHQNPTFPGYGAQWSNPGGMSGINPYYPPAPGANFNPTGYETQRSTTSRYIAPGTYGGFAPVPPITTKTYPVPVPSTQRAPPPAAAPHPFRAPTASAARTNKLHPLDRAIPAPAIRPPSTAQRVTATVTGLGIQQTLPQDINPDLAAYLATTNMSSRPPAPTYSAYDNPSTYAPFYPAGPAPPTARAASPIQSFTPADYNTTPPLSPNLLPLDNPSTRDALTPDPRPLAPDQLDGSRYGIELGGIGSSLLNTSDRLKWMGATADALASTSGDKKDTIRAIWEPEPKPFAKWNPPDTGRKVESRLGKFLVKPREGDGWGGWKRASKLGEEERERREKERVRDEKLMKAYEEMGERMEREMEEESRKRREGGVGV